MRAHLIPHGPGILVLPWNVNTAEDIARTLEMGVDGVIVEDPLLVQSVSSLMSCRTSVTHV